MKKSFHISLIRKVTLFKRWVFVLSLIFLNSCGSHLNIKVSPCIIEDDTELVHLWAPLRPVPVTNSIVIARNLYDAVAVYDVGTGAFQSLDWSEKLEKGDLNTAEIGHLTKPSPSTFWEGTACSAESEKCFTMCRANTLQAQDSSGPSSVRIYGSSYFLVGYGFDGVVVDSYHLSFPEDDIGSPIGPIEYSHDGFLYIAFAKFGQPHSQLYKVSFANDSEAEVRTEDAFALSDQVFFKKNLAPVVLESQVLSANGDAIYTLSADEQFIDIAFVGDSYFLILGEKSSDDPSYYAVITKEIGGWDHEELNKKVLCTGRGRCTQAAFFEKSIILPHMSDGCFVWSTIPLGNLDSWVDLGKASSFSSSAHRYHPGYYVSFDPVTCKNYYPSVGASLRNIQSDLNDTLRIVLPDLTSKAIAHLFSSKIPTIDLTLKIINDYELYYKLKSIQTDGRMVGVFNIDEDGNVTNVSIGN